MSDTNIGNLANAQAIGWADAPILRIAANRVSVGGKEVHDISAIPSATAIGWSDSQFTRSAAGVINVPSMITPLGSAAAAVFRPTGGHAGTGFFWSSIYALDLAHEGNPRFRFGYGGTFLCTEGIAIGGTLAVPAVQFTAASTGVATIVKANPADGGILEFIETTAPSAPATNRARVFCQDNGSGKTQLMVRFATGAAVQIAIEP